MNCPKCGKQLNDGAKFCPECGTKIDAEATGAVAASRPEYAKFSNITVRYCCPNGHAFNGSEGVTECPECKAALAKGGYIQLYRMGNMMGVAVGMGIYIDDIPFGHIANKQSIRISVPFGPHKVHVTHTATRKCNDPIITVTPEQPYAFCKAHFVSGGFKIAVDPASPDEMPEA